MHPLYGAGVISQNCIEIALAVIYRKPLSKLLLFLYHPLQEEFATEAGVLRLKPYPRVQEAFVYECSRACTSPNSWED